MKYLLTIILIPVIGYSQLKYPTDYFSNPIDIPIILAGTFAELRPNHFHSGVDIKTQGKEGLKVFSAAEGYVSRIKVQHYGFGKSLYITHPNGYTTVYTHLKKYSPTLEKYIKDCQYEKESYEVELFPSKNELPITKGELVAYSGNTGSSTGPHLHYEIRDNEERPINPLLFGLDVPDNKVPRILELYAYTKDPLSHVNGLNGRIKIRLIPTQKGDFTTEKLIAEGDIGFGVVSYDQQDHAYNKNGLFNIQTFTNGSKSIEIDFQRFSFDETSHINRLIDYDHYKKENTRIQKLFVEPNNPLSLYKDAYNDGYVTVLDSTSIVYRIRLSDFEGNESWISIPIEGESKAFDATGANIVHDKVNHAEPFRIDGHNIRVFIPSNSLYENASLNYSIVGDTLKMKDNTVALRKNFIIEYDISRFKPKDKDKLFIAELYGYKKEPNYLKTDREGDVLKARSKSFGDYCLVMDSIGPTIKAHNFKDQQWISNKEQLVLNIEDDISGINGYRATINGKWVLMEYEYKNNSLTYDFSDGIIDDTEHNLKVIVTDNVGNSSTFEATFFRK